MRKGKILIASLILGLTLTACGSSGTSKSADNTINYSQSESAQYKGAGVSDNYDTAAVESEASYDEAAYDEAAPEEMDAEASGSNVTDKENSTNKLDMEKLIYRCSISLETEEFENTVSSFQQIISKYNGFVEVENTSRNGSNMGFYTATVRVPSDQYKSFVNDAGSIGTLKNKSQNVTNVSQEYSDLSVEMEVLEAQRDDYMEMLKEAKSLEDMDNVILISDKIASVNTQINQIKTRLNSIDNDVAYSYIDINIQEVRQVVEYTEDTFGTRFMKEVKQGWYDFAYGLQNFVIWFVANIWGILIFVGIIFLIIFIVKKIVKKTLKKAEERKQQRMGQMQGQPQMQPQPQKPSPYQQAPINQTQNNKKSKQAPDKETDK
ncbi:MAG: DUF4349 domain-containing protein [Eubacterium sp.]|nr:DUF4349 domain-containing protein [Eubacterium sp.]